jgi:hypothetical protein
MVKLPASRAELPGKVFSHYLYCAHFPLPAYRRQGGACKARSGQNLNSMFKVLGLGVVLGFEFLPF